jgi:hypothetical protein
MPESSTIQLPDARPERVIEIRPVELRLYETPPNDYDTNAIIVVRDPDLGVKKGPLETLKFAEEAVVVSMRMDNGDGGDEVRYDHNGDRDSVETLTRARDLIQMALDATERIAERIAQAER